MERDMGKNGKSRIKVCVGLVSFRLVWFIVVRISLFVYVFLGFFGSTCLVVLAALSVKITHFGCCS
ncbi:transmembrane protein, putative [Medicago truncatula]|uniref:Transmembrane protein, putative n=1 Tax=Medicago truncatula TaxID=3880 RepID=A0A072VLV6_MEDTR|nr:transmembrane protein, putative [Medicago truncatula]